MPPHGNWIETDHCAVKSVRISASCQSCATPIRVLCSPPFRGAGPRTASHGATLRGAGRGSPRSTYSRSTCRTRARRTGCPGGGSTGASTRPFVRIRTDPASRAGARAPRSARTTSRPTRPACGQALGRLRRTSSGGIRGGSTASTISWTRRSSAMAMRRRRWTSRVGTCSERRSGCPCASSSAVAPRCGCRSSPRSTRVSPRTCASGSPTIASVATPRTRSRSTTSRR